MGKSIESYAGSAIVLVALLLFLLGMVFRLASIPLGGGWITEVTIYLVAWGLLLSAAGCVAHGEHVRADFFLRMIGPRFRYAAELLAALAGLAFCTALAWFGFQVVAFALAWDERGPSYLQIPTAWFYAALPVSMVACSLRYAVELMMLVRRGLALPESER
ncbi:MAG: TRAP transporter small permease [Geminicoccaceae bacterium]